MKAKLKILILFSFACPTCFIVGQGLNLPDLETLEEKHAVDLNTVDLVPSNPTDFIPPENGKLSLIDAVYIAEIHARLQQSLTQIPEGENGQDHSDFAILQQLTENFLNVTTTKDRASLFASIPAVLAIISPCENCGYELSNARGGVSGSRIAFIQEIAFEILENSANIPPAQHGMFMNMFCHRGMREESDWEDEPIPIDSAGLFVTDATNAAAKLQTKTLGEIKTFLGGSTENSFFERYEAAGDGMAVLKAKYAANKAAIQARFEEVIAFVAQLENQE